MADNERDELLQRFTDVIGQPFGSTYFEEEELLEIFDYAGDLNDNLVRMEVLMWGAKLYPNSTGLAERRGLFYYNLGEQEGASKIVSQTSGGSALQRLLALRLEQPDPERAKEVLDDIVNDTGDFKDEEIIQLVQTANEMGLYSWLKDRREKIEEKCSFPQSFLYESVGVAEDNEDYDYGLELIEKLTELEPFNSEFWEMSAEYYNMHYEDPEMTLNAAEYALAINPDAYKALVLKAKALCDLKHSFEEIDPLIKRALELGPDEKGPIILFSMIYSELGKKEMAEKIVRDFLETHPADRILIGTLLVNSDDGVDEKYFTSYYENERPDAPSLIEWSREILNTGSEKKYQSAAFSILRLIPQEEWDEEFSNLWVEIVFSMKDYSLLNSVFEEMERSEQYPDYMPKILIVRILATGVTEMTQSLKDRLLFLIQSSLIRLGLTGMGNMPKMNELFQLVGVISVLKRLKGMIENDEKIDPDLFTTFTTFTTIK